MLETIYSLILAGTLYATAGTVTSAINDIVQIETTAGTWTAYGDDLETGDNVALLMYDVNDTPNDCTDDVILSIQYVAR